MCEAVIYVVTTCVLALAVDVASGVVAAAGWLSPLREPCRILPTGLSWAWLHWTVSWCSR